MGNDGELLRFKGGKGVEAIPGAHFFLSPGRDSEMAKFMAASMAGAVLLGFDAARQRDSFGGNACCVSGGQTPRALEVPYRSAARFPAPGKGISHVGFGLGKICRHQSLRQRNSIGRSVRLLRCQRWVENLRVGWPNLICLRRLSVRISP